MLNKGEIPIIGELHSSHNVIDYIVVHELCHILAQSFKNIGVMYLIILMIISKLSRG